MKTLQTAFMLVFSLTICMAQSKEALLPKLDLTGVLTVHIKSVPQAQTLPVKLATPHSFPQNDANHVRDSITVDRNEIYLNSPSRTVSQSFLTIADSTYQIVGAPGDTINLFILAKRGENPNQPFIAFAGKNKEIQQYYQAKTQALNDPVQACMNEGMRAANLVPFKKMMDETYQKQDQFWMDYQKKHTLPDWFKTYETNALNYTDAWLRVYMIWYQIDYQKKKQVIPASYYEFKRRIKVKNLTALYHYDYLRFLREQLFWQMRQEKQALSRQSQLDYAKQELGQNAGSFFEIWELSSSIDNPNRVETDFKKQFPAQYQYLVDYIKQRVSSNVKLLRSGDKAPQFALVDANDSLITLNQYKGQVVYLSFWFTTCGACIKEMPCENKLVEQFKGKPVKIVSICTPTPGRADEQQSLKWKDSWKAASKRFGLKTTDLYANPAWAKTLSEKYSVSTYPHYVLIGADGKIIENFADRPSQGIAAKIEKAIAAIKE
ncbi:TlpA family protein disulfide reductase [Spirosoma utsteinense]|uniref:Peroxiredoxin n=1 Tax=Spirosoma utsteinense TaxID=2585773 RepID=A0ABR6WE80_9BACT|nr:TlpA disulfide reductase family protein [Spirosoma utsteinense]MBC3788923.1 peroxiredoxin [Spirosoma utsteinense]MBC3794841.1 peroxiredoxin [Spirosoma utsteinense]